MSCVIFSVAAESSASRRELRSSRALLRLKSCWPIFAASSRSFSFCLWEDESDGGGVGGDYMGDKKKMGVRCVVKGLASKLVQNKEGR